MPQPQLHHDVLSRILAVARHLSATADLQDILQVVIDAMRDTLNAERATVFEYDANTNELFTTVAHGVAHRGERSEVRDQGSEVRDQRSEIRNQKTKVRYADSSDIESMSSSGLDIRIPANAGLAGECAQSRRIINVPDAYADPRFNQDVDRQTGYRTRSILTIPLLGHPPDGELVGVAQVLNKRGGVFTEHDEEIAQALAAQAAVAMKRGRLIEDRLVREKLERDLELARRIQQGSFPTHMPNMLNFDIAAWNEPADSTGGDVYDVIERDVTIWRSGDRAIAQPDESKLQREASTHRQIAESPDRQIPNRSHSNVVLLMADATGHGVGPALSVTQLRSMLRMAVLLGAELPQIARHANRQLAEDLPDARFITAWFGELDDRENTLTTLSAGQAPLLRYSAADDRFEELNADTVPLGIVDELELHASVPIKMMPGDIFAVISDGIFESRGRGSEVTEQFGMARAMHCIRANRHAPAEQIIHALRHELQSYSGDQIAEDDRTVIIIKRRDQSQ